VIEDEKTGLLVEQKQSKELAGKILRLLEDPALRRRLAGNARDFADHNLTWDVIGKRYRNLYHELAAS
jgi:glycosyltransferase involved in cell wall biosynthesis